MEIYYMPAHLVGPPIEKNGWVQPSAIVFAKDIKPEEKIIIAHLIHQEVGERISRGLSNEVVVCLDGYETKSPVTSEKFMIHVHWLFEKSKSFVYVINASIEDEGVVPDWVLDAINDAKKLPEETRTIWMNQKVK